MSIAAALRLLGGRFAVLSASLLLLALGIGMTPACTTIPLIVLNAIVIGVGFGVAMPLSQAVVFDSVPPDRRGVAMGARMTGNRTAQMAGPLLFGFVIRALQMSASFVIGGLLMFALAVPMLLWWARSRRITGRAPAL